MSSSYILSDNGVSSGSAGLKSFAGNDGTLLLQTATSSGTATTAVTVDNNQNVGVGTTSPGSGIRLDVQAAKGVTKLTSTTGTNEVYYAAANTGGGLYFGRDASVGGAFYSGSPAYGAIFLSTGAYPMTFAVNSVEAARIDSSGNFYVGGTSQLNTAKINFTNGGNVQSNYTSLTGADMITFYTNNGGVTYAGKISSSSNTTSYVTSSDYRLKDNVQPITGALARVAALKPVTYTWKSNGEQAEGFIAHELAEVCPQAVDGEKDAVDADGNPIYQGIDTSFLVATLTAAIKEQQAIIQTLTQRVEALEGAKA